MNIAENPLASCEEVLNRALQEGTASTLFFYLDPYGIQDLDFEIVKKIYERDTRQSTEVLINFNFRAFMRMSGNWAYEDTPSDVARKVKASKIATVNAVMGGDYWLPLITNSRLSKTEREDAVVDAYIERVRNFFRYTYAIPVKELEDDTSDVPVDNIAKYHLIFGTRNVRAVRYMNDCAHIALEPYFNQFKEGLLFPMTPDRYAPKPREEVKTEIVRCVEPQPLTRPDIYEALMPQAFLQYRSKDYRAMIDELVFKEGRLFPDPNTMKRKTSLNNQTRLSARPWNGATPS